MAVLQGIGLFILLALVFAFPSVIIPAAIITYLVCIYKEDDSEEK